MPSEHKPFQKSNLLTVPNAISLFRLCLIPAILWLYLKKQRYAAAGVLTLSAFSDVLDGRIARRYHLVSDWGKILDPLADKLTQMAMLVCLMGRYPWMAWLFGLFCVKELLQAMFGYLALRKTGRVSSARWYGKASTVTLYAVVVVLVLSPSLPEAYAIALAGVSGGMLMLSLVLYARLYLRMALGGRYPKFAVYLEKILPPVFWLAVVIVCLIYKDEITVERIVDALPKDTLVITLSLLLLFAVKSISLVIYNGVLYAASGLLLPMHRAILVNAAGTVVMSLIPYLVGQKAGAKLLEKLTTRYPKLQAVQKLRGGSDFLFSTLMRAVNVPFDVGSAYMGAAELAFLPYLLGSVAGMLPSIVLLPILGTSLHDPTSPRFIVSLLADWSISLAAALMLWRVKKHSSAATSATK